MKLVKAQYYSMEEIISAYHAIEESGVFDGATVQGQTYSFQSWLRRIFFTDGGVESKPDQPGIEKKQHLHRFFEFVRHDTDV